MIEEVFENLLSSLDQQGMEERGDEWNQDVLSSLESLRRSYANLRQKDRKYINYSELSVQAAYIFAYAIGRAEFTYVLLKKHREILGKPIFSKNKVTVTSIGGGPGSEIAGLVKYLLDPESGEHVESITYWVLDKGRQWEHLCQSVVDDLEGYLPIELNFRAVDLCEKDNLKNITLKGDDLIILSFIISELFSVENGEQAKNNLRELYKTLDVGAKIFYNDNDASSFYYYFNETRNFVKGLGRKAEINEVKECISIDLNYGNTYFKYIEELDANPQLRSECLSKFLVRGE